MLYSYDLDQSTMITRVTPKKESLKGFYLHIFLLNKSNYV